MNSEVGLAIQCVGIMLVTLLSYFMMRTIKFASLRYWTLGWTSLSLALISLYIAFRGGSLSDVWYAVYYFGEYLFGFMLVAGCRQLATGKRLTPRLLLLLVPGFLVAAALPQFSKVFSDLFIIQALIMAGFFAAAYLALRPARRGGQVTPGLRVMSAALLMLTLDFLHYVPIFILRDGVLRPLVASGYLAYTSIFDLIFETLLGFGIVMVLMEEMRRETENANRELALARDQLERLAHFDSLTDALNRRAFYSLIARRQAESPMTGAGAVVMFDIDNLKPINDRLGHAAGDGAIRAAARAARSLIRADDMLFRWGGDEFSIVMFGVEEAEARKRLEALDGVLAKADYAPCPIGISCGFACFDSVANLEAAIERADAEMYERKQLRKQLRKQTERSAPAHDKIVAHETAVQEIVVHETVARETVARETVARGD